MADADPEQEAVTVSGRNALIGLGDVGRVVGPHVDDRRGDGDGGCLVEHSLDEGEIADRCSAAPQPGRGVAELLGLDDELGAGVVVVAGVEPGPDLSQLHSRVGHDSAVSVGTIWSVAMRSSRSPNRKVRSTVPPGKLPSRWVCTS